MRTTITHIFTQTYILTNRLKHFPLHRPLRTAFHYIVLLFALGTWTQMLWLKLEASECIGTL